MNGASTPADFIEQADYATEFRQIKHPYYSGVRALETHEYKPVGGNRDLKTMVDEGKFREDFCYRLNVFPVFIPPLRER